MFTKVTGESVIPVGSKWLSMEFGFLVEEKVMTVVYWGTGCFMRIEGYHTTQRPAVDARKSHETGRFATPYPFSGLKGLHKAVGSLVVLGQWGISRYIAVWPASNSNSIWHRNKEIPLLFGSLLYVCLQPLVIWIIKKIENPYSPSSTVFKTCIHFLCSLLPTWGWWFNLTIFVSHGLKSPTSVQSMARWTVFAIVNDVVFCKLLVGALSPRMSG